MSDDALRGTATALRQRLGEEPFEVAVVLGSGLGQLADKVETPCYLPYEDIPHFPVTTAHGHAGRLVAGRLEGRRALIFQGRFHMYEGHTARQAALPVRLAHALGVQFLLLTNAVGAIHGEYRPGDFMYVADHLNLLGDNPLRGESHQPFVDLTHLYDQRPFADLQAFAESQGMRLHRGILAGMLGPSYETPAEIRALRSLGADVVSMSMIPEAIMAAYLQMRVVGLSHVSNAAAGLGEAALDHQDVLQSGQRSVEDFCKLCCKLFSLWRTPT